MRRFYNPAGLVTRAWIRSRRGRLSESSSRKQSHSINGGLAEIAREGINDLARDFRRNVCLRGSIMWN